MSPKYLMSLDFVDLSRLDPAGSGRLVETRAWIADDPEGSDAVAARNTAITAALAAHLSSLTTRSDRRDLVLETMEDDVTPEVMIRRFHRARVLSGETDDAAVEVTLMDNVARLAVAVDPAADVAPVVSRLCAVIRDATGYVPVLPWTGHATSPEDAATALLDRHRHHLTRLRRQVRREAVLARFGVPSIVIMTLLAWVATVWIGAEALRLGRVAVATDATRPMTFVTLAIPPAPTILGLFPDYALDGTIAETGQPARVKVYRDQVIRAGYQARFTVFATSLPDQPFVLQAIHDRQGPVVTIGPVAVAWFALIALLPAGLWGWLVVRPWWTTPTAGRPALRARMTRTVIWGAQIAVGILVVALIRLYG